MKMRTVMCVVLAAVAGGCGKDEPDRAEARRRAVDEKVRASYGKSLAQLPVDTLVAISPHNENIQREFEEAFSLARAQTHGRRTRIEWRDVGGGGSAILRYLRNVYGKNDKPGIDIVWGGGEPHFIQLARENLLQPMQMSEDILANIPEYSGGLRMYGPKKMWCGSAVSGFGFLYNKRLLAILKLPAPATWDDLGKPAYFDAICLADPTESGSAAATYEMIVQSADTWPAGWAKLLSVLGNAKRFLGSAGAAANAPARGEAPIATCIDFYGATRVVEAPDILVYVSPAGQTAFSPDPIAILKNPPHPQLAQAFVDFVLSRRGQALWALKVGSTDGPVRSALGRQPIRRDVYDAYAGELSPWIVNPYAAGGALKIDAELRNLRYGVLKQLVRAAAIDNRDALRAARKKLIASPNAALQAQFDRLPDNVSDRAKIADISQRLKDPVQAELILTGWVEFFRAKYKRIAK